MRNFQPGSSEKDRLTELLLTERFGCSLLDVIQLREELGEHSEHEAMDVYRPLRSTAFGN